MDTCLHQINKLQALHVWIDHKNFPWWSLSQTTCSCVAVWMLCLLFVGVICVKDLQSANPSEVHKVAGLIKKCYGNHLYKIGFHKKVCPPHCGFWILNKSRE